MSLIRINKNPSRKELGVFGVCWVIFFGILGAGLFLKTSFSQAAIVIEILAVAVPIMGWIWPSVLRHSYLIMSYVAYPIGMAVSLVLLLFVYFLVITPVGIIMRAFGHDPLKRKVESDPESYWIEKLDDRKAEDFFRQF